MFSPLFYPPSQAAPASCSCVGQRPPPHPPLPNSWKTIPYGTAWKVSEIRPPPLPQPLIKIILLPQRWTGTAPGRRSFLCFPLAFLRIIYYFCEFENRVCDFSISRYFCLCIFLQNVQQLPCVDILKSQYLFFMLLLLIAFSTVVVVAAVTVSAIALSSIYRP